MEKTAVIYWSATGNTEAMAEKIADGLKSGGDEAELLRVDTFGDRSIGEFTKVALGCPAMGNEVLEECDFEPFFTAIEEELKGKKVALFGSYDWGDGEWMRIWEDRVRNVGALLYKDEGLIIHLAPDEEGAAQCKEFGAGFAAF